VGWSNLVMVSQSRVRGEWLLMFTLAQRSCRSGRVRGAGGVDNSGKTVSVGGGGLGVHGLSVHS
jgi:hypothetical protein